MRSSTRQAEVSERTTTKWEASSSLRSRAFRTPWGDGKVLSNEEGLLWVDLPPFGAAALSGADSVEGRRSVEGRQPDDGMLERWAGELEGYFRGERLSWRVDEIPWEALRVGKFARAVYEALLATAPGETVGYGELAEMAGYPRAARAVGSAMAANPVPVLIPCHRVIRADGSLGMYGDSPGWKARLLEHERSSRPDRGGSHA